MAVYHAESLLFGPFAERPDLNDPTIYSASGVALFLAIDTGELYETSGSAWTLLGILKLPGVTSDAAGNLTISGAIDVGTGSDPLPSNTINGGTTIVDSLATLAAGEATLVVLDSTPLEVDTDNSTLWLHRTGALNGSVYRAEMLSISSAALGDTTAFLRTYTTGSHIHELGRAGGLGLFGNDAPTAPRTLPQATIDAMTDVNAKASVQAVANALADMGALTLT